MPRGTLYLVPNLLGVVPPAAVLPQGTIDIARRLEHYVVETPKAARQFLKALHPQRALQAIDIVPLDEHATYAAVAQMLAPALAGEDIGLMSDAGCPGVADPGVKERLTKLAIEPLAMSQPEFDKYFKTVVTDTDALAKAAGIEKQ